MKEKQIYEVWIDGELVGVGDAHDRFEVIKRYFDTHKKTEFAKANIQFLLKTREQTEND